ncbi:MAG: hypothetical protein GX640_04700, partial [Fibrobacter sp.]|nr:hypothetical protein [Fibrobacter sp.]
FVSLLCLGGCAARYTGYGPHFSPVEKTIKRIAILNPEIYSFDVSEGGINEFRVDWSDIAKEKLAEALTVKLNSKGFIPTVIKDTESGVCTDTVRAIIKIVTNEIQKRLYGKNSFYNQIEKFDYSTGSVSQICNLLNVDALLFVFGLDENYSVERIKNLSKTASVKTARSTIMAVISTILIGSGTIRTYSVPFERTYLSCTEVDTSGQIVWFKKYFEADGYDMRKPYDAAKLAQSITKGFRIGSK